jgi:membrane-bound lytic murein transglycosylase A
MNGRCERLPGVSPSGLRYILRIRPGRISPVRFIYCLIWTMAVLSIIGGCAPPPPAPSVPAPVPAPIPPAPPPPSIPPAALERLAPEAYPVFSDCLTYDRLSQALELNLEYLAKLPPQQLVQFGADSYPVSHICLSLEVFLAQIAQKPSVERLMAFITEHYLVYRATGRPETGDVLFTGYYEPLLEGRRTFSKAFSVPVHSRPADLLDIDLSLFAPDLAGRRIVGRQQGKTVVPYPDRKQIRLQTGFNRLAPPIVWLRDEIDRFILQIQGSGRIDLGDGSHLWVQYAGSNGLGYRSVGRLLIDTGRISAEAMSMQAIRDYLREHPQEKDAIMDFNPRYIFFRQGQGPAPGALGFPLTALRSIAVDPRVIPMAALAFITTDLATVDARGRITGWSPYQGFVLTQDTGSAITGPGRVDLFWGNGKAAEVGAGHLKHPGQLYFLVLKQGAD